MTEEQYSAWKGREAKRTGDIGMAEALHVDLVQVPAKAKGWSAAEDEWLRLNYPRVGQKASAAHLGRSCPSIRAHASRLGIKQDRDSPFAKDWQARAAQSKVGKKRPEHAATMRKLCAERGGKLYVATEETRRRMG